MAKQALYKITYTRNRRIDGVVQEETITILATKKGGKYYDEDGSELTIPNDAQITKENGV